MYNVALDCGANVNSLMSDIKTEERYIDYRSLIALYDGVLTPKEVMGPAAIAFLGPEWEVQDQKLRRIVRAKNLADANFLSEKKLVFGLAGSQQYSELMSRIFTTGCAVPPRFSRKIVHDGSPVVSFEFMEGLIFPPENITLDDIITFKAKHRKEYENFWSSLQDLATDPEWALSTNPQQSFEQRVGDLIGQYEEAKLDTWGKRVKKKTKLRFVLQNGLGTSIVSALQQLEPVPIAILGFGAAMLSVDIFPPKEDKQSNILDEWDYLHRINNAI